MFALSGPGGPINATGMNDGGGRSGSPGMGVESFNAFQAVTDGEAVQRGVATMSAADLPADGVLVEVHWSSVNYKDGLASTPTGRVARISPIVPGIDLAGVVVERRARLPAGTEVLAHGYDLGVSRHGGFAEYARVPADWLVPCPTGSRSRGHGDRHRRLHGRAVGRRPRGARPHAGRRPGARHRRHRRCRDDGGRHPGRIGYEVVASTGKADGRGYLRPSARRRSSTAPSSPRDRARSRRRCGRARSTASGRRRWPTCSSDPLRRRGRGQRRDRRGDLPTTVMPFILRGVSLLGIDSVQTPIDRRRACGSDSPATCAVGLDEIGHDVGLDELDPARRRSWPGGPTAADRRTRSLTGVHRIGGELHNLNVT